MNEDKIDSMVRAYFATVTKNGWYVINESESFNEKEYKTGWISYDFGKESMKLEGSNDGQTWTPVRHTILKAEEKQMNKCEFELGDILIGKNKFDDETDGELILICPGYKFEDFSVKKNPKGVKVEISSECKDCGEIEVVKEFFFEYSELFEAVDVKYNVHDGIFVLQAIYDLGDEVEVDNRL